MISHLQSRFAVAAVGLAAALVVVPASGAGAAVDGPKVNWKLAAYGKARAVSISMDKLAELVAAQTNGNFRIEVVYGATLSPEKEVLDGLKLGAFEAGWVVPAFAPGKQPGLSLLSLPFLPLDDLKVQTRVSDAFHKHPAVKRDFDGWGVLYGLSNVIPSYEFMGSGKAPEKLADWKGLRVRALGGQGTAMAKLGAVATTLTSPEVYGGLERGLIDAAGFPYYAFEVYKLHEISKWYTKGLSLGVSISTVDFAKAAHDKLPPQYKKLIADVTPAAHAAQSDALQAEEDKAEAAFKKQGVRTVVIPPAMREEFSRIGGRPVWDEWVKDMTPKGYPAQEMLDFVLNEAKKSAS